MADGQRLGTDGQPAPLAAAQLAAAAKALGPATRQGMISEEDTYYFGHHEPVTLPAYRVWPC